MRRGVALVLLLAAAVAPVPAAARPTPADIAILHLDGRGYGHGVGMPQWGAKYAADAGAGAADILATFYPGTRSAQAGGAVRIRVLDAPDGAILAFPTGGEIRSPRDGPQAAGFPVAVAPGQSVVVRHDDGGYHVEPPVVAQQDSAAQCIPLLGPCPPDGGGGGCELGCVPTTTTAPPTTDTTSPPDTAPPDTAPPETAPPDATPPPSPATSTEPVWAIPAGGGTVDVPARGRAYRGVVQAVGPRLRLVNELDVETYLKGMAEVPSSWPAAAQQAQAVAARTWVLRAMAASGEVCDDERCQVYVGASQESPGQDAAVDATRGRVLTFGGGLAATVYSSDAGGVTALPSEGFGTPDAGYPYLTTVAYDTPDPLPWSVDVALADVAARFGYAGTLSDVRVASTGPSGRAAEIVLDGSAGPRSIPGRTFASRLGLRSTLFTASTGTADVAPIPPPEAEGGLDQLLPDDAAGLGATLATPPQTVSLDGAPAPVAEVARPRPSRTTPVPVDVDVAGRTATLVALAMLGGTTAVGMARLGGVDGAVALVSRGRRAIAPPSPRARRSRGRRRSAPSPQSPGG